MKKILIFLFLPLTVYGKINGEFYAEFKRKDFDCVVDAKIFQKKIGQITFRLWDELCEDTQGNSYESSLGSEITYEKIAASKIKVIQNKDSQEVFAKIAEFKNNEVHYDFEVDTEDGHLEINEHFKLDDKALSFSSIYILDGKEIINRDGIILKKN